VELVEQSKKPTNLGRLPDGYKTVRVQRTLDDLRDQLKWLVAQAVPVEQKVPPPLQQPELQILNVSSNPVNTNYSKTVMITGAGFSPTAIVKFNGVAAQTKFVNGNLLVATVPLQSGTYKVTVDNQDGMPPYPWPDKLSVIS
jgi:hypothetical protein